MPQIGTKKSRSTYSSPFQLFLPSSSYWSNSAF